MPVNEWRRQAQRLKQLMRKHGLLADPTRTADIASVLRVPGTTNWKDLSDPKPVQILKGTRIRNFRDFIAALEAQDSVPENAPPSTVQKASGFPLSSSLKMIKQCRTLAYVADVRGKVSATTKVFPSSRTRLAPIGICG